MKGQTRTEFAFVFGSLGLVCPEDPTGAQSVEAFVVFGQQLFSLRGFKQNKWFVKTEDTTTASIPPQRTENKQLQLLLKD